MVRRTNKNVKRRAGCTGETDWWLNPITVRGAVISLASIDAPAVGTYNDGSITNGIRAGPQRPTTSEEKIK
jgi:hypothetical protein